MENKNLIRKNYRLKDRVLCYFNKNPHQKFTLDRDVVLAIVDKIDKFNEKNDYGNVNFFYWGINSGNYKKIGCDIDIFREFIKLEPVKEYMDELEELFSEELYRHFITKMRTSGDCLPAEDHKKLTFLIEVLKKNKEKKKEYICFVKNLSEDEVL